MKASDLPDTIAVFPLPGALLLPRARLPLHIFEPRYLAMLTDCMKTGHRLIGMVQPRGVPEGAAPKLHAIGCAGRLTGFSETEDGRYMITLSGIARFRVKEEVQGFHPYRRCQVDWQPFIRDMAGAEADPGFRRAEFLDLLGRYFQAMSLSTDWGSLQDAEEDQRRQVGGAGDGRAMRGLQRRPAMHHPMRRRRQRGAGTKHAPRFIAGFHSQPPPPSSSPPSGLSRCMAVPPS